MDITTFYEVMVTEYERSKEFARNFLYDKSGELSYILIILLLTFILTNFSLQAIAVWKMKQYISKPGHCVVFLGQLFLAAGLWTTAKSIESFNTNMLHSFMLSAVACYFFSGSVFLSYDFRRPPSQRLGTALCIVAVGAMIACVYCKYKKLWTEFVAVSSILGLNVLAVGISFIALNVLEIEYQRFQFAFWRDYLRRGPSRN